jgi:hypothetical protein
MNSKGSYFIGAFFISALRSSSGPSGV